jgi:hypothetical protein
MRKMIVLVVAAAGVLGIPAAVLAASGGASSSLDKGGHRHLHAECQRSDHGEREQRCAQGRGAPDVAQAVAHLPRCATDQR